MGARLRTAPVSGEQASNPIATPSADTRWRSRPWFARAIRLVVFVIPIGIAFAVALLLTETLHEPSGLVGKLLRLVLIAGIVTVVLFLLQRLAKRLLPLAALFSLSLVFPDEAPSRFGLALRSGTTRDLRRALDSGAEPTANTPRQAAEELLVLVANLSKHDRLTRGHSERVRGYSRMLGQELELDDEELDRLHWAGLLHDVGKLGVSPEILNKPGALTPDEFEAIKAHTVIGEQLTAPIKDWLGGATSAVWEHHERYTGGGYPTGRPSSEMALATRIISVADAFDVMTSARSYKRPISATAARAELERCAGTQFDPLVVRAMMTISLGSLWRAIGPLSLIAQIHLIPRRLLQGTTAVSLAVAIMVAIGLTGAAAQVAGSDDGEQGAAPVPGQAEVIATDPEPIEPIATVPATAPTASSVTPASVSVPIAPASAAPPPTVPPAVTAPPSTAPPPVTTTTTTLVVTQPAATTTTPTNVTTPTTVRRPAPSPTTAATPTTLAPAPLPLPTTTVVAADPSRVVLASSTAGDVVSQAVLPMLARAPINGSPLPNYDVDRDPVPGLTLRRSTDVLGGSDPAAIQRWRWTLPSTRTLTAPQLLLWVGSAAPAAGNQVLLVSAGLYRCAADGSNCVLIGADEVPFAIVPGGFGGLAFDLRPTVPLEVAAGSVLELRVAVPNGSDGDIALAYDSFDYPAQLALS
jgi:HD-GYP domain-containing protein (c-di-GMP phosphodiesterase class II)